jgi:hypothetical protein
MNHERSCVASARDRATVAQPPPGWLFRGQVIHIWVDNPRISLWITWKLRRLAGHLSHYRSATFAQRIVTTASGWTRSLRAPRAGKPLTPTVLPPSDRGAELCGGLAPSPGFTSVTEFDAQSKWARPLSLSRCPAGRPAHAGPRHDQRARGTGAATATILRQRGPGGAVPRLPVVVPFLRICERCGRTHGSRRRAGAGTAGGGLCAQHKEAARTEPVRRMVCVIAM